MSFPKHAPGLGVSFSLRQAILSVSRISFGLALLVFLLEQSMLRIGFFNEGQAVWWPTNGLALALLLRFERRKWPMIIAGILLGTLVGQFYGHRPFTSDMVNMLANMVGPLLGALLLPRFEKLEDWLREPGLVSRFIGFALLLPPMLSAAIFAFYLHFAGSGYGFWKIWQRRDLSDMLGYALFTPLVLVLSSRDLYRMDQLHKLPRAFALLSLLVVISAIVFGQSSYPLAFVLATVTLLVTLRLGFRASVIGVNLLAAVATAATMQGHGPFILGGGAILTSRILLLQSFLCLSMISALSVSVIQMEREAFQVRLRLAYEKMKVLADVDPLTGVNNRRRFEQALNMEWARAYRTGDCVAVLMIDVDEFKSYNDSYGHPAGDDCLRAIANVARSMERRSTDLLARYGGEEFIFLLPTNTRDQASQIAEKIRSEVEKEHEQQGSKLRRKVTVSIGCAAIVPGAGFDPVTLINASDQALYRAKEQGRNRVEVMRDQDVNQVKHAIFE